MDDAYSPHKAIRHLDVIQGIKSGEPVRPAHVQIILSDLCNQSCLFCFPQGSLVFTAEGFVPIEDVEEGDLVYDRHGEWKRVLRTMQRSYEGDSVKITLQKYAPGLLCTNQHGLDIVREGKRDWVEARHVMPGDFLVVPLPKKTSAAVSSINVSDVLDDLETDGERCRLPRGRIWMRRTIPVDRDLGRLLGYYLGDGHASFPKTRPGSGLVVMSINAEDQWVQDEIKRLAMDVLWLEAGRNVAPTSVHVSINSTVAARLFEVLCGVDAYSKQIHPALLLNASDEFLEGVLEGYARTDGCIADQSFSSVNQKLVMGVFLASLRLGLSPAVFQGKARGSQIDGRVIAPGAPPFTIRYRGDSGKLYARLVGAAERTTTAGRGGRGCNEIVFPRVDGGALVKVKGVEHTPSASVVYNIEVEDSHSYTVNLLSVANCAYRDPTYSSSQMFYQIEPGRGLHRDAEHLERNYNPNRMISYEKVIEILEDCKAMGVSGAQFTGGGEPTVHPMFPEILEYTRGLGIAYSLVSNGVNLFKKWREHPLLEQALAFASWTRISIDAGDPRTYSKIRGVPAIQFDYALEAVRLLRRASDISPLSDKPVVGVGFVVTPENWNEVVECTRLAKLSGAHNIRISAQFSTKDETLFAGFYDEAAALCRVAETLSCDDFKVYNRFGEKLDDLRQHRPKVDRCGYQFTTTYIGGDLNVYRCCVTSYNQSGLVGSLQNQRFKNLWMSQSRVDEMNAFNAKSCERCQFNRILGFLDYATREKEPQHSEFV